MPHIRAEQRVKVIRGRYRGPMPANDDASAMAARQMLRDLLPLIAKDVPSLFEVTGPENLAHGDNPHPKGSNFQKFLPEVLAQYPDDAWNAGKELRYHYQWYWPHTGENHSKSGPLFTELQLTRLDLLREVVHGYQYNPVGAARLAVTFCRTHGLHDDETILKLEGTLAQAELLAA